jgi:hypothetical protein
MVSLAFRAYDMGRLLLESALRPTEAEVEHIECALGIEPGCLRVLCSRPGPKGSGMRPLPTRI